MCTKMCISSHEQGRKHKIELRFAGHPRIVGAQYGSFFIYAFLCLEFRGGARILGELCAPLK